MGNGKSKYAMEKDKIKMMGQGREENANDGRKAEK
jgi:hypothetical protein